MTEHDPTERDLLPPRFTRTLTDRQLTSAWQRGDEQALAELLRRHGPALRRHLDRRFPPDLAEEAYAETLAKLARGVTYRHRGSFRSWLFTVGRRGAIDLVRRSQRRRSLRERFAHAVPRRPARHAGPRQHALRQKRRLLDRSMRGLSPVHREALRMRYWGGRSTDEIARALGLSPGQVRDRIAYALKKLRAQVPQRAL